MPKHRGSDTKLAKLLSKSHFAAQRRALCKILDKNDGESSLLACERSERPGNELVHLIYPETVPNFI